MKGITKRLLALLMALCMLSSLLVTAGATEDVSQESSGNTLTEEEANALFKLAFASAPDLKSLTLLHTIARRTVLQKVPYHALTRSRCL